MNQQKILREKAKYYKWAKDISYKAMAEACGLAYSSFINWLHNDDIKLSVKRRFLLEQYLDKFLA